MVDLSDPAAIAPGGYTPGLIAPVAAAYQRDPRRLLVQSLMQQGQQAAQNKAYNPWSALANALSMSAGGVSGALLAQQYQQANQGAQDTIRQAIAEPDFQKRAEIEAGNPYLSGQALQTANQAALLKAQLIQKLAEQHLTFDDKGNVVPMAGAPEALRQLAAGPAQGTAEGTNTANAEPGVGGKAAEIKATTPALAAQGAAVENAKNPALIARAGGTAAATAPIDIFKAQFNPQVDRNTGEIVIPGMDPAIMKQVMSAMHVDPTALAHSLGWNGAPAPKTNVVGSNLMQKPQSPAPTASTAAPPSATPAPVVAPQTSPAGAQSPPTQPGATPTVKPFNGGNPATEIPHVQLPTGLLPKSAATIVQGRDPIAIKAGEQAVDVAAEKYKEVQKEADAQKDAMSDFGVLRTQVQNGGIDPSALTPAKAVLSAYLNATVGHDYAMKITGIDPAKADLVNKVATRMGLTFARQTEGARESVQAIQIALGANPGLANTKEGFLKIIDLMEAGAKHDIDAQTYGNAWFQANHHYVGSSEWFAQHHPPAEYTSAVMPYNLPPDPKNLQPNVTYQTPNHGLAKWNGSGFVPVK